MIDKMTDAAPVDPASSECRVCAANPLTCSRHIGIYAEALAAQVARERERADRLAAWAEGRGHDEDCRWMTYISSDKFCDCGLVAALASRAEGEAQRDG